jgi:hypothetical protein
MATLTLTDEELLQACLDEAFRNALAARKSPDSPALNGQHSPAARFREVSRRFENWLSAEGSGAPADPAGLWQRMFEHATKQEIEAFTMQGLFEEAAQFSAACQAVCSRLSSLREGLPAIRSWREILTAQPLPFEQTAAVNGSLPVTIKATAACLRHRSDGGVDIVEHRLGPAEASEEDLIRFAIRAWMLQHGPRPVQAHGLIEAYAPELDDVVISAIEAEPEHLQQVFDQSVRPVLAAIAG